MAKQSIFKPSQSRTRNPVNKQLRPTASSNNTGFKVAENVTLTPKQHEHLVQHIKERMDLAKGVRDNLVDKYSFIDKELHGYIRLDDEDKKRELDNQLGYGPKTTDMKLQLVMTQIEDATTYMVEVFNADEGLYAAVSTAGKQAEANGFTRALNEDGDTFDHVGQLVIGCRAAMKYNLSGWLVNWKTLYGQTMEKGQDGGIEFKNGVVYAGNEIPAIDMYNFFWDPSVDIEKLYKDGEYFGIAEAVRFFALERLHANGEIFGDLGQIKASRGTGVLSHYLANKPDITTDQYSSITGGGTTNWTNVFSPGGAGNQKLGESYEVVWFVGWIVPSEFGLSKSKKLEIWRFMWVNEQIIVFAQHLNNAHGMLPCAMTMPIKDEMGLQTRSYAERLIGLGRFGSNELNIHQRASRKSLYGVTIYDPTQMPLMEHADLLAGKVPWNPGAGMGQTPDINKAVKQFTDTPDTNKTMENLSNTIDMMQYMLPTDIRQQVAGLERAVTYQVAAVVQGTNRRAHMIALVINAQALLPLRTMLMFNVFQFRAEIEVISEETGELAPVPVSQLLDAKLIYDLGMGLKGIDRIYVQEMLKEILMAALQSKSAQDQLDLVGLMNYVTSVAGDKTDLNQFKFHHPLDALPPEQKDLAMQLLQQAAQQQGGQNGQVIPGNGQGPAALSDFSGGTT